MICANKSNFGHGVAAAGVWETIMSFMTLHNQTVPHIRGLKNPLEIDLNFARENKKQNVEFVVKNSLVFGGLNYSFVLKRY